tara:strand:+ start:5769 stop:6275 length:507 start_codon:yes stop_codon:yes gene_type:complete
MIESTGYEFDDKNREDFDANTKAITDALLVIENDKKRPASLAEVARLTGLHRNTLSNRSIVVGTLELQTTVSDEISRIKKVKRAQKEGDKETEKQHTATLEELLDSAKNELVFWFKKYRDLSLEFGQMEMQLARKVELVDWYKKELQAERDKLVSLEEQVNLLKELKK